MVIPAKLASAKNVLLFFLFIVCFRYLFIYLFVCFLFVF